MDKTVLLCRAQNYDQALVDRQVEFLFGQLEAAEKLNQNSRVLLKPNLLAKHPPEAAVTTHPAVVRAVIRALKKRGVTHITLADSCGGLYNPAVMKSLYKVSGLWQVCQEEGVECYTECRYGTRPAPEGRVVKEFTLIQPVLDSDFIIDLAKFKTHVMAGCTAATKNLFGCIPGLQKAEWHMRFPDKERFGDMLIDLLEIVRPRISLVDGILGLEGDGPAGGTPRQIGLLLAGEDPLTVDLAVCGLMGLDPMRVPYLAAAQRRGLCDQRLDPALLQGDTDAFRLIPDFALPQSYQGGDTDFAHHVPGLLQKPVQALERVLAPHPVVMASRCIGCGKCAEICPQHTIRLDKKAKIRQEKCIRCFCCHEMCPVKAIQVKKFSLFRL